MSKISVNIKKYRKTHNLSQTEFAQKLHVTKQAVSKWETGRGNPDFTLIPVIAKELGLTIDEMMGENLPIKKGKRTILLIITLFVLTIIISPIIVFNFREDKQFTDFSSNIENETGLELPNYGSSVNTGINKWAQYGNALVVREMSYMLFDDNYQTTIFETSLIDDSRWVAEINEDLLAFIPLYLVDYADKGDYFIIYNKDLETFNDSDIEAGSYEYMFIVYQNEVNRFLVFEYLHIIEE